ncbi:MAG TPA: adenosylcobalamin-dependent ribonucleoside-diphosphate reductase [Candidatus Obscuribacterales bacterium]
MLSANALKVLEKRYFLRDLEGHATETAEALFRRVSRAVAAVESRWGKPPHEVARLEERFMAAMMDGCFMPNSPTLMNAGKERGQLSACFVLPVPDSLDGIFETCKNAALIHKTGGGTGFSFNRLRPANDRVASTTGVASGPVSFMLVYDAATEAIRQGGTRRGANMGILNVDHPDIEEFISSKRDTGKLNNFNISVAVTEDFMRAVQEGREFALVHPSSRQVVKKVPARQLFDKIVENAHATGEPGIIFLDRINAADPMKQAFDDKGNIVPGTEDIEATNPCGEQPLGPGDACNLGSINLASCVDAEQKVMDWTSLKDMVYLGVRFLDDIIEANHYPLDFIARAALGNRRIGLGVMGWAEALIKLGIPYDSQEAIDKAEEVMSFIQRHAHDASQALAEERGTFPNWPYSTWYEQNIRMRNATVTTIAPTGTISIIAGTSSGIEPVFAVSFVRRVLGGTELTEVNPLFEQTAKERGFYSEELMRKIAEEGTVQGVEGVPDDVKRLWKCAHDIPYIWHVRMQAAFQKYTDCAVSKTINFPAEATVDDVKGAYWAAYELGLKGLTVYRDTSRLTQVLSIGRTDPLKKAVSAGQAGAVTSPRMLGTRAHGSAPPVEAGAAGTRSAAAHVIPASGKDEFSQAMPGLVPAARTYFRSRAASGCPECSSGSGSLVRYEACRMCTACGYTKC